MMETNVTVEDERRKMVRRGNISKGRCFLWNGDPHMMGYGPLSGQWPSICLSDGNVIDIRTSEMVELVCTDIKVTRKDR